MNDQTDSQLLRAYAENRSEAAFSELVRRHVDIIHSAAQRMVCDSHLAQDVTQGVFVALAKSAGQLAAHPVLSGWLHRTAQNIAAQTVRTDVRRRAREQEATAMNELLAAEPDAVWEQIAPHLDGALSELTEPDRDVLLLRYFERKSAREMAEMLGISAEAAQKRVNRAVDRLRECFASRGVAVGASGLVVLISTNAVQAAPVGLAVTVTSAATLAGAAVTAAATTTATTVQTIAMTTLQKVVITTALAAAIGTALFEVREVKQMRAQHQASQEQIASLTAQIEELQQERDVARQQLASVSADLAKAQQNQNSSEVLKLRGQVGVLLRDNEAIGKKSALSKITADPATFKVMRDQQKAGMGALYGEFAKGLKLETEVAEQFNDLLADGIMDGIALITQSLQDKKSQHEIDRLFTAHEAALERQMMELLGPEGLAQYREYSKNLLSTISAKQFEGSLTGDAEEKTAKSKQLQQLLQEESLAVLNASSLPASYQTVPMLNFRNIASTEQEQLSLQVLDRIYERAAGRASGFLSAAELEKFQAFRSKALENNRAILNMNRQVMAPIVQ